MFFKQLKQFWVAKIKFSQGKMTTEQQQDETLHKIIAAMGPDLGRVFYALYLEVVWLHAIWLEYCVIYGTSKEQLQIANRAAGFFFRIVQDELWDSVLLRIARLHDDIKTSRFENLTLKALPPLITDSETSCEIKRLVDISTCKAKFAREHRNKRIAHSDLSRATNPASVMLDGISRRQIEEMLEAIRKVMNAIDFCYRNLTVGYEFFDYLNGANRLLNILRRIEQSQLSQ